MIPLTSNNETDLKQSFLKRKNEDISTEVLCFWRAQSPIESLYVAKVPGFTEHGPSNQLIGHRLSGILWDGWTVCVVFGIWYRVIIRDSLWISYMFGFGLALRCHFHNSIILVSKCVGQKNIMGWRVSS